MKMLSCVLLISTIGFLTAADATDALITALGQTSPISAGFIAITLTAEPVTGIEAKDEIIFSTKDVPEAADPRFICEKASTEAEKCNAVIKLFNESTESITYNVFVKRGSKDAVKQTKVTMVVSTSAPLLESAIKEINPIEGKTNMDIEFSIESQVATAFKKNNQIIFAENDDDAKKSSGGVRYSFTADQVASTHTFKLKFTKEGKYNVYADNGARLAPIKQTDKVITLTKGSSRNIISMTIAVFFFLFLF